MSFPARLRLSLATGCVTLLLAFVALVALVAPMPALAGVYDDLLQAMERNDVAQVMQLLQRGMDVNTSDRAGNTLLMLAARNGETEILDYLLQNRASLLKRNRYGDTALMLAALNGHQAAVERLVAAGAEIDPSSSGSSWTPLTYAAFNGHVAVMRFLLDHGAAVDARAANGATALMIASRNGHPEAVRLLLARHADVSLLDRQQQTALEIARAAQNLEIADLLQQAAERSERDRDAGADTRTGPNQAEEAGQAEEMEGVEGVEETSRKPRILIQLDEEDMRHEAPVDEKPAPGEDAGEIQGVQEIEGAEEGAGTASTEEAGEKGESGEAGEAGETVNDAAGTVENPEIEEVPKIEAPVDGTPEISETLDKPDSAPEYI